MPLAHFGQVLAQGVACEALHAGIEGGAQGGRRRRAGCCGRRHQPPADVRSDLRFAIQRLAASGRQHLLRMGFKRRARRASTLDREDRTRSLRHLCRLGVGCADQGGGQRGLCGVETARVLLEHDRRHRPDAHQLAAKADPVEVGLEDLVLGPGLFQLPGHAHLAGLGRHAAATLRRREIGIEQAGQLHRHRRGAPRAAVPEIGPSRCAHAGPVHTRMFVEALVFGQQQGVAKRRRHVGQGDPLGTTQPGIGAHRLDRHTVAIEHHRVRRTMGRPHLIEARQGRGVRRGTTDQGERCNDRSTHRHRTVCRVSIMVAPRSADSALRRTSRGRTSLRRASPATRTCPGCSAARCTPR